MKPSDIARSFEDYLNSGSTPKGVKVQSFFRNLDDSLKKVVSSNIHKAHSEHLENERKRIELRKSRKKEIAVLKKKAKELGLKISE